LRVKCNEILQALSKESQEIREGESEQWETLIRWDSPPAGWTVLNTDGASKGNLGKAGGEGVLRGDKGGGFVALVS